MSVATFFSSSVSFARFVEPRVRVCAVVTVCKPLITTMSESWVRFLQSERLNDTLKFGLPVMSVSAAQPLKHLDVFVAFCPNPAGRTSETSDKQP